VPVLFSLFFSLITRHVPRTKFISQYLIMRVTNIEFGKTQNRSIALTAGCLVFAFLLLFDYSTRSQNKALSPVPDYAGDEDSVREEFAVVLHKLRSAPIIYHPFPHIEIDGLFTASFYDALMANLPPAENYARVTYAGTDGRYKGIRVRSQPQKIVSIPHDCCLEGATSQKRCPCWYETFDLHSADLQAGHRFLEFDEKADELWRQVARFVHSCDFMETLAAKFVLQDGLGIPDRKRNFKSSELRNSAAMRYQSSPYHLSPHVDVHAKLVTWQMFTPSTNELMDKKFGTFLYVPAVNIEVDDTSSPPWLAYDNFKASVELPCKKNFFFAFAPNNHSFHGARITREMLQGVDPYQRRTFLGFITRSSENFHHFSADDWTPPKGTELCEQDQA